MSQIEPIKKAEMIWNYLDVVSRKCDLQVYGISELKVPAELDRVANLEFKELSKSYQNLLAKDADFSYSMLSCLDSWRDMYKK